MGNIRLDLSPLFERIKDDLENQITKVIVPNVVSTLSSELSDEVDRFVHEVQEKIVKMRAPSKTGKLRSSIMLVVDHRNTRSLVIRCYAGYPSARGVPYAASIEFGRKGGTEILPTRKKALSFVGKPFYAKKKWAKKQKYYNTGTMGYARASVTQGPIRKVEMFQAGLDFIYQNIATVLAHKMNTIDFSKFRFTPGGRGGSIRGPRPIVTRTSTAAPSRGSAGNLHIEQDIDIDLNVGAKTSDADTINERDFN